MQGLDHGTADALGPTYLETRVGHDHPLRRARQIMDEALVGVDQKLSALAAQKWPVQPERVLRAMALQALYRMPSDSVLIDWLEHDLPTRWFIGMTVDDTVWSKPLYARLRNRLSQAGIADPLIAHLMERPDLGALKPTLECEAAGQTAPSKN